LKYFFNNSKKKDRGELVTGRINSILKTSDISEK